MLSDGLAGSSWSGISYFRFQISHFRHGGPGGVGAPGTPRTVTHTGPNILRKVRGGIFPLGGGIFGEIFSFTDGRWHRISVGNGRD
jgi:hypothetical protein